MKHMDFNLGSNINANRLWLFFFNYTLKKRKGLGHSTLVSCNGQSLPTLDKN
jgi:hypothetical protein